jgi:hypothetical protein
MALTIEFSDGVKDALGKDAAKDQDRIKEDINKGLEELGKKDPDAKALFESGQKIRIVCFGSEEAKKAGLVQGDGMFTQPASTQGDFDEKGKPKKAGTAIVAIDCGMLSANKWDKPCTGDKATMFEVLIHELLHAANKDRKHPPDEMSVYEEWVKKFKEALEAAKKADQKKGDEKKGDEKKSGGGDGGEKKKPKRPVKKSRRTRAMKKPGRTRGMKKPRRARKH